MIGTSAPALGWISRFQDRADWRLEGTHESPAPLLRTRSIVISCCTCIAGRLACRQSAPACQHCQSELELLARMLWEVRRQWIWVSREARLPFLGCNDVSAAHFGPLKLQLFHRMILYRQDKYWYCWRHSWQYMTNWMFTTPWGLSESVALPLPSPSLSLSRKRDPAFPVKAVMCGTAHKHNLHSALEQSCSFSTEVRVKVGSWANDVIHPTGFEN